MCNHTNLFDECFNLDKIRGTIIKSPVCRAISLERLRLLEVNIFKKPFGLVYSK